MVPLPLLPNKFPKPILCYVTDSRALGHRGSGETVDDTANQVLDVVRECAAARVDWVQLREKHLPARELVCLAREASAIARAACTTMRIIINGRLDVAVAVGGDGIHLGAESLPVESVFKWRSTANHDAKPKSNRAGGAGAKIAPDFLIGVSCHYLDEIQQAEIAGADYIFFGPIFPTPSKKRYGPPLGLEKLAEACGRSHLPVLAIGGITPENAGECLRAGASGIAAIRLFQKARDLRGVIDHLHQLQ
jgi:thiamine-phosphate pyrophosphorylase